MAAEIPYVNCYICGKLVIVLAHTRTGTPIPLDPLPVADGYVKVDFELGQCQMVPASLVKHHRTLWQPHVVSCGTA